MGGGLRALYAIGWLLPLCFSASAWAQETQPAISTVASCELHIWPGNDLRSSYHGWFHGSIVDGAVQGREGYRTLPSNPLPVATQRERLQHMPLADLLGLPNYSVVVHEASLDSRTLRSTPGRLATHSPSCYAELAIDDIFFQEDLVEGRFLKVLFRFRAFTDKATPTRRFGTYIQEKLLIFPPTQVGVDPAPGMNELATAFEKTVSGFGNALTRSKKAAHHE